MNCVEETKNIKNLIEYIISGWNRKYIRIILDKKGRERIRKIFTQQWMVNDKVFSLYQKNGNKGKTSHQNEITFIYWTVLYTVKPRF